MNDSPCVTVRHSDCCCVNASASPESLRHDMFLSYSKGKADVAHPLKGCATSVSSQRQFVCKRCESQTRFGFDEDGFAHCLKCGAIDYQTREPVNLTTLPEGLRPSILSLDYIGLDTKMEGKKMKVKVSTKAKGQRGVGKIKYTPSCPHCGANMGYPEGDIPNGSVIKKKNDIRTHSVRCPDKHRVHMVMNEKEEFIGWR